MRKCRQWVGGDGFGAILRVDAINAAGGWVGGGLVTIISSAPAGRVKPTLTEAEQMRDVSSNCTRACWTSTNGRGRWSTCRARSAFYGW